MGRAPDFFLSFSPVVSSQALFPWQPPAGDRETAVKREGYPPSLKEDGQPVPVCVCVCDRVSALKVAE